MGSASLLQHHPPPSLPLILKVSLELSPSFSAGWWDHRHLGCSWCRNTGRGLRVRNHHEWQGYLIISVETIAAMVNFIFIHFSCLYLHQPDKLIIFLLKEEMTVGRKARARRGNMNIAHLRSVLHSTVLQSSHEMEPNEGSVTSAWSLFFLQISTRSATTLKD